MLKAAEQRLLATIPDGARVLDVGGGVAPFPRADIVLDHLAPLGPNWIQRDICHHEPWPFAAGEFDFAICSQTLEDVRDPIWVCHELNRVAGAGYIEVPSRLAEQSFGAEGPDWSGWSHHHWLCDIAAGGIRFTFKYHVVHRPYLHLPREVGEALSDEEKVQSLHWDGSFEFEERVFFDAYELEADLRAVVDAHAGRIPDRRRRPWRIR